MLLVEVTVCVLAATPAPVAPPVSVASGSPVGFWFVRVSVLLLHPGIVRLMPPNPPKPLSASHAALGTPVKETEEDGPLSDVAMPEGATDVVTDAASVVVEAASGNVAVWSDAMI